MPLTKGKGLRNFPRASKGMELFSAFAPFLFESFHSTVMIEVGAGDLQYLCCGQREPWDGRGSWSPAWKKIMSAR